MHDHFLKDKLLSYFDDQQVNVTVDIFFLQPMLCEGFIYTSFFPEIQYRYLK